MHIKIKLFKNLIIRANIKNFAKNNMLQNRVKKKKAMY